MHDIYEGHHISAWKDEDGDLCISFPWVTVSFPSGMATGVIAELGELVIAANEAKNRELKELIDGREN